MSKQKHESRTFEQYLESDADTWAPPPAKPGGPPVFVRDMPIPWEPAVRVPPKGTLERLGRDAFDAQQERDRLIKKMLGESLVDMSWLERLAGARLVGDDGDVARNEHSDAPSIPETLTKTILEKDGLSVSEVDEEFLRSTRGRQYKRPKAVDYEDALISYIERETGLSIEDIRAAYARGKGKLPGWAVQIRSEFAKLLARTVADGEVPIDIAHAVGAAPRTLKRDIKKVGGSTKPTPIKKIGRFDIEAWSNGMEPQKQKDDPKPWESANPVG